MDGISFSNLEWLDALYRQFKENPESIDASWRHFFEGWDLALSMRVKEGDSSQLQVYHLIEAYRIYGHLAANVNPIALMPPGEVPQLKLENFGFSSADLDRMMPTCGFLKEPQAPLKVIVEALKKTYCQTMGIEYMGLGMPELEKWIQSKIEPYFPLSLTPQEKLDVLHDLNRAGIFEAVLHTKYTGQKRFSLEGGEALIPLLTSLLEAAGDAEISEAVLGMAHRGRLNVLVHVLSKSYLSIFYEFEDYYTPDLTESVGDVKYHRGLSGHFTTKKGKSIAMILSANPSHLESVDPVVEGIARARQEIKGDREVLPLLIHGDAALAGQGVVYETMQMSRLNGYKTGGTIHIDINNHIGFTTLPKDSRSTRYPTDIALAFGAPVLHVNGEKPEECVMAAKLALEIRQKFHCDVFIDLNCYRKYGHNEGDEPAFTQPLLYELVRSKKSVREMYRDELVAEKVLASTEAQKLEDDFKNELQKILEQLPPSNVPSVQGTAPKPSDNPFQETVTAVSQEKLVALAQEFCTVPASINVNPKVKKLLHDRLEMVSDPAKPVIDWGMAEHLAYASLLTEAVHVRISGQDSRRGTFSHRHAAIVDSKTETRYFPLSHLKNSKAKFDVFNSPLSEYAVLGFEYGYSMAYPQALVIWEAQYGDFANGAQIVIDQYISSGALKWGHVSRLTLLLPHGYEGGGSEHSSARLERFLQLSADNNMYIVNCTTTAQVFHVLRRQALSSQARPLIVFFPKMLLRFAASFSALNDFTAGTFQEFIDDPESTSGAKRVIFCCGKVYYDLVKARKNQETSIVRIEQPFPFNKEKFKEIAAKYKEAEWIWVQEEHANMGAWSFIHPILEEYKKVRYVGRAPSGAPAAGSHALHKKQLEQFLQEAFL